MSNLTPTQDTFIQNMLSFLDSDRYEYEPSIAYQHAQAAMNKAMRVLPPHIIVDLAVKQNVSCLVVDRNCNSAIMPMPENWLRLYSVYIASWTAAVTTLTAEDPSSKSRLSWFHDFSAPKAHVGKYMIKCGDTESPQTCLKITPVPNSLKAEDVVLFMFMVTPVEYVPDHMKALIAYMTADSLTTTTGDGTLSGVYEHKITAELKMLNQLYGGV